jgi:hypothetical protein
MGYTGHWRVPPRDEQILHKLGYAQELFRAMGGFQNFAISFTIISILAGCLTSYYIAFLQGGPIAVTWGWLLVGLMSTIIALAMAEIASAYPTAGGLLLGLEAPEPGLGWAPVGSTSSARLITAAIERARHLRTALLLVRVRTRRSTSTCSTRSCCSRRSSSIS